MQNTQNQQIPDELICPITRDWLEDPISLPCCGRAFSRQSIVACLSANISNECPMCRQSLNGFDVNTAPKSVNIAYMVEQARSSNGGLSGSSTLPPIPPKPEAKWVGKLYKLQNNNSAYQSVIGKLEVSNSNNAVSFKTLLVPVIDRSGSMAGNPIKQAQYSLNRIVDLTYQHPNLCTNVVAYDDGGQTLKLNTALSIDQNKASIATMLAKSGGTSFKAAFDEVLKICQTYNNVSEVTSVVIIFLTDGQDSSPAENGRAALVNAFKTSITQCWKKQFTVHTVGFGSGHDYAFLNNLRQIGTSEGAYRYADPNEDSDSLSNKIHSILNVVVKSSSIPLEILPHPTIPMISGDNGKYWVDLTNDTTSPVCGDGDPSQGYKFQLSINNEPPIEVAAEMVEVHDDTALWNEWYTYLVDEIATEILALSQTTSVVLPGSAPANPTLDREIHYEYLLQRGRAIAPRLAPDSPNVERLSKLMDSVKTIQAGGQVNQSKLNDMKFEGKYATSGQTSASGPIKVLDSVIPPQQWTSGSRGSNWPTIKRPYLKRGRKCPRLFGGRDSGVLEHSRSNAYAKNLIANKPGWLTAVDADGFNSLMVASSIGRCAVLTYLLDSGLFNDPSVLNKTDKNGYNALDLAILYGHWRTYEILRGVGAKPNQDGNLLLRTCLSAGHFNLADRLYNDKFCQVDTDMVENAPVKCLDWLNKHSATEISLETAIAKGVYDRVEKEVNAWINLAVPTISWKPFTELFTKPSADHLRIVELLLKNKRADANEQIHVTIEGVDEVTWPLFMAAEKGQLAMVKLLLKHVSKDTVNQQNLKGTTCLWIACCNRHIDVVTLLLDKGADPNLANFKGDSPLIPCCQKGSDALVEILLDSGADLGAYNKNRDNPVIICCRIGQAKILEILLKRVKGAELKTLLEGCAQIDGFNPLLAAAEADKADCIRVCHKYGADLEFKSADDNAIIAGATALHLGCFYGKMASVKTLCELGADVFSVTTVNGWSALHIAIKQGHSQVVQYLLNMSKERAVKMLTITDKDGKTPKYYVSSGLLDEFFTNKLAVALERVLLADPETQMRCAQTMVKYGRSMGCYDYNETTNLSIDGQSVLTQALLNNSVPLLSTLQQMGADPFLKDDYGMSPLFWSLYLSNQGQSSASNGALTLLGSDNSNIPIPDDLKAMLDRVKGVQGSSLQNRMLTNVSGGRPLLTQENRLFANPLDNLLKMSDGYPLAIGNSVVSTLKDESTEDQSLLGFIEKLRNNKVFPDGKQFLDHILWDAKVHIIRMLASGETRLQPIHLMALYLYTGNSTIYKQVNMTLNKWDQNSVWHPFICCLYQAIGLLPEYKAEAYRAVESGVFNLTDYAIGKKVEWNTFSMASSEWKGSAELINGKKGIIFIIKSLTGRQIGKYSKCPADSEVIFLPGTKFEITDHYVGKVFVLGQANIRKTSYRMKEPDYEKALKGEMCTIVELAEIDGTNSAGQKGTTITI